MTTAEIEERLKGKNGQGVTLMFKMGSILIGVNGKLEWQLDTSNGMFYQMWQVNGSSGFVLFSVRDVIDAREEGNGRWTITLFERDLA